MIYDSSIAEFLKKFESYGDNHAVIWHGKTYSYKSILEGIDHWRKQLHDIPQSSIVGLESDFSPNTIAILFVLIELNTMVVPFDVYNGLKNDKKKQIAQIDWLIIVKDEDDISIQKYDSSIDKNPLYAKIQDRGVPGLVLFTSGSSGEPKGALHDFSKLLSKFDLARKSLRTINFLLFDHWGGLNTLFHILSNGGTVVVLENRNPDYVCELIEKHKVELLPTSPTFLNMLILSRAYERRSLESLKLITYGSEPMPENLLSHLNRLFPEIKFQQTYGLIELGVMRSQSENNSSLWVKIGGEGYETRIVDNLLEIKSDSAMLGYLNAPSPFTEDGWFKTGDAVEVRGDYLKILGRKSELINVGGEKVFPQEVENLIMSIEHVLDVVVYGEKHPFTGNIVCAKVVLDNTVDGKEHIQKIKSYCRQNLEPFKVPVKISVADSPLYSSRLKKNRV